METIKSKREFDYVFHQGRRVSHRLVRLTALAGEWADGSVDAPDTLGGNPGKVAFVAARRLGNAVYRNRCKRVLREAARACGWPLANSRVILFATRATHDASPAELAAELPSLLERCVAGRGMARSGRA